MTIVFDRLSHHAGTNDVNQIRLEIKLSNPSTKPQHVSDLQIIKQLSFTTTTFRFSSTSQLSIVWVSKSLPKKTYGTAGVLTHVPNQQCQSKVNRSYSKKWTNKILVAISTSSLMLEDHRHYTLVTVLWCNKCKILYHFNKCIQVRMCDYTKTTKKNLKTKLLKCTIHTNGMTLL